MRAKDAARTPTRGSPAKSNGDVHPETAQDRLRECEFAVPSARGDAAAVGRATLREAALRGARLLTTYSCLVRLWSAMESAFAKARDEVRGRTQ